MRRLGPVGTASIFSSSDVAKPHACCVGMSLASLSSSSSSGAGETSVEAESSRASSRRCTKTVLTPLVSSQPQLPS